MIIFQGKGKKLVVSLSEVEYNQSIHIFRSGKKTFDLA